MTHAGVQIGQRITDGSPMRPKPHKGLLKDILGIGLLGSPLAGVQQQGRAMLPEPVGPQRAVFVHR
jgi:hypothetical protein